MQHIVNLVIIGTALALAIMVVRSKKDYDRYTAANPNWMDDNNRGDTTGQSLFLRFLTFIVLWVLWVWWTW